MTNKNTHKTADMILNFPDKESREKFFETNVLNEYNVLFETFNTDSDVAMCSVNVVTLARIISEAKPFGGKHYLNCGGQCLADCAEYEKKCGNVCDYCQYMELDVRIDNENDIE
jgi:hypothetical protein